MLVALARSVQSLEGHHSAMQSPPPPWGGAGQRGQASASQAGKWVFQPAAPPPEPPPSPWQQGWNAHGQAGGTWAQRLASASQQNQRTMNYHYKQPAWTCQQCGAAHMNPKQLKCRICRAQRPRPPWQEQRQQPLNSQVMQEATQQAAQLPKMPPLVKALLPKPGSQPATPEGEPCHGSGDVEMQETDAGPAALQELEQMHEQLLKLGQKEAAERVALSIKEKKSAMEKKEASAGKTKRVFDQAYQYDRKMRLALKNREESLERVKAQLEIETKAVEEARLECAKAEEALTAATEALKEQQAGDNPSPGAELPAQPSLMEQQQGLAVVLQRALSAPEYNYGDIMVRFSAATAAAQAAGTIAPDLCTFMWTSMNTAIHAELVKAVPTPLLAQMHAELPPVQAPVQVAAPAMPFQLGQPGLAEMLAEHAAAGVAAAATPVAPAAKAALKERRSREVERKPPREEDSQSEEERGRSRSPLGGEGAAPGASG